MGLWGAEVLGAGMGHREAEAGRTDPLRRQVCIPCAMCVLWTRV